MEKWMKNLTVEAIPENLPVVTAFIEEQLEQLDCPLREQNAIALALDELFSNIAYYAYGEEKGDVTASFTYEPSAKIVSITLTDQGVPFNPLEKEDPDVTLSAGDREIGGLGIFLVKKMMDAVTYRYEDGCNHITMQKRIPSGKIQK